MICIIGPTGTGKSELSLTLAERLARAGRPAEIVNADAMQLYRGMDIGTAKLSPEERRGIPHHMLDVLDVTTESTVAGYQADARAAVEDIIARGSTPILVGGSGLYVASVIYDFQFPASDKAVRARLEAELESHGPGELFRRLSALDADVAARIGSQNTRRLVRALEVAELTGSPVAGMLPEAPVYWRPTRILGLRAPRDQLVARLDERVERMWSAGLLDEVRGLVPQGIEQGVTASRAIGYAQALRQLAGTATEAEAIDETQQLTRRYARRQVSWFRRYADIVWLDYDAADLGDAAEASVTG
ncbi:tRNA (adenosine(37)-N6)-dimethylallyltransferase MiaA [Mycetocola manganoxydans]|uniref:tRNA dimethylallyltransferase n=1 Tax=Mycetocola manganoxydans TaxID=699879 RepID=A0A3L6ZQ24_9MICO|nr:tRNA (adenosine(37)-N6)-dimethylallyltransferase MiaA [Mycetocola manganoxydans]RLP69765.1 tRNA (adenosine(37)-N6)-dimethylallyltransferase MiaA [Mycetocola manganoxydans]GHD49959.1 tRNA dimethylallyltransferase [Mycetocola manganoxydans]